MTVLHAIILAIIEGLTEYLPVSSTGHMIIGSTLMGIEANDFVKLFTVAIQFGAILSVVVLYWRRFTENLKVYPLLFVAFLPAVFAGLFLKHFIDLMLENVTVVAVALLLGGILFLFLEKLFPHDGEDRVEPLTLRNALIIGCFQVVAMIPGISRSAATIIGGITQGLSRRQAAEFSFLLAVPTMFAATMKSLWDYVHDGGAFTRDQLQLFALGNVVAFIVAALAIKGFVGYLTKHGFAAFGWYRIVLGTVLLVLILRGVDLSMV